MLTFLLLVLVPSTALALVLGMARLEDGLLRQSAPPVPAALDVAPVVVPVATGPATP